MNTFFRIFILSFFFLSCSSDLDFDQVNDLKLKPVGVGNLATFEVKASQLLFGSIEISTLADKMNFQVFNDVTINKFLIRTDLFFEINNTINRDFKIDLYLLDENNVQLYAIPFVVPAYVPGQLPVTRKEIFENATLDVLKQTKNLAFQITMLPGIPLTQSSLGSLKMSSSATVYLEMQ
jgi:hypothetical protein